jgi:hypothetical protein
MCTVWSQGKGRVGNCSANVAVTNWVGYALVKEWLHMFAESKRQPNTL